MTEQSGGGGGAAATAGLREYRKGNWSVGETMVLIEAKKMDDERRMKRVNGDQSKPTELRWKWVEDYCWRKGCFRSQNQCNDKWDNLMRDYKKVRDHERRIMAQPQPQPQPRGEQASCSSSSSYWKIDKAERKDKNLPSNMLPQIYEALVEVVENKGKLSLSSPSPSPSLSMGFVVERGLMSGGGGVVLLQTQMQHHHYISAPIPSVPLAATPQPAVAAAPSQPGPAQPPLMLPCPHPLPTRCGVSSESSDTNEYSGSPAKRRKRSGEGTSGSASASNIHEVGTAISKSASIIAEALQACEDREETRHKELLGLHERRLRVEESKAEVNRQGINGLVDAINKLANSIYAMASYKNQSAPPE